MRRRRGAVPVLRRRRHPAQPRRDPARRGDRAGGDDLQRPLPRLDLVRDRLPVRQIQDAINKAMARGDARPVPAGGPKRVQPAAVRRRRRRGRGVGRDAVQRHRRQRRGSTAPTAGRLDESIDGAGVDQDPADRADRAALPAARRARWRSSPTRWASAPGSAVPGRGSWCTPTGPGEMECITFGDGMANPPHGVIGGTPGCGGGAYVEDADRRPAALRLRRAGLVRIARRRALGRRLDRRRRLRRPRRRDRPSRCARDVRDGYRQPRGGRRASSASSSRDDGDGRRGRHGGRARARCARGRPAGARARRRRARRPGSSGTCATATSTSCNPR